MTAHKPFGNAARIRAKQPRFDRKYQAQYSKFCDLFEEWLNGTPLDPEVESVMKALLSSAKQGKLQWTYKDPMKVFGKIEDDLLVLVREVATRPGVPITLVVYSRSTHPELKSTRSDAEEIVARPLGKEQAWVWLLLYPQMMSAWDCFDTFGGDKGKVRRQQMLLKRLQTVVASLQSLDPENHSSYGYWLRTWLPRGFDSIEALKAATGPPNQASAAVVSDAGVLQPATASGRSTAPRAPLRPGPSGSPKPKPRGGFNCCPS